MSKTIIESGKAVLGIEFGSTRIKAVLIDEKGAPIAMGAHDWENRLENGIWTYHMEDVWAGLQDAYADLCRDVKEKYEAEIRKLSGIGFSAMMHGYLAFNGAGELLVPFRTWRNTMTQEASEKLTEAFSFQIPQRWSIAHLYQAMLNKEEHVKDVAFFTTLDGYIHWQLTGRKVLGIGSASGMFPIDSAKRQYDAEKIEIFDRIAEEAGMPWKLRDLLPEALTAGEIGGFLTEEGARKLDPTGKLQAGCPLAPPEGDAGTGMVATNSVGPRTGNVSAGTSVFAMIVLENALKKVHSEIDMVTTPSGDAVAMVHCNNCTSDLNAWAGIFREFAECMGMKADMNEIFGTLYRKALEGDKDCGGLMAYNYYSGEHITGFEAGRPLFMRTPDASFNLANFMRTNLYTCLGALKVGMDILLKEESVAIDKITGHGGLFKTKGVGQSILAAAMNAKVSVMKTAGEGGAWGMALLAAYMVQKGEGETLPEYLQNRIFGEDEGEEMLPDPEDVKGFDAFAERYVKCLPAERAALDTL